MDKDKIRPIAKQYETDSTKFKLCVYFHVKPCGTPYSHVEKIQKKHRKYIDSYDYVNVKGGKTITRHDVALNKLLHFVEQYKERIEFANLYMNDFVKDEQHLIGKFFRDEVRSIFIMPTFTEDSYGVGHYLCSGLQSSPIETVPIRKTYLKKNVA